jgi:FkbM family methyltransferase
MGFVPHNDDVFQLSGNSLSWSKNLTVREQRTPNDCPVSLYVSLHTASGSTGHVDLTWNPLTSVRRARGELVDFSLTLNRSAASQEGDVLILRFPLSFRHGLDPDFALVGAAAFSTPSPAAFTTAQIGFGAERGLEFATPFDVKPITHMLTSWKFEGTSLLPFMDVRLPLKAGDAPVSLRIGRLFAGYDYDPYVYNPDFEYLAHLYGRPEIPGAPEVAAEFERLARDACTRNRFRASQAFVKPFFVMREGRRRFPMLIGTLNSMNWYALQPQHGIDFFEHDGHVRPGDVVLDCGAHAGQMSAMFGLVAGKRGKVIAFDPFPQNYLQVEAQARLNGFNLESPRAGVGNRHGSVSLSICGQMTAEAERNLKGDMIDMKLMKLDDFIDAKPTFLKLDVEGAEVDALWGAREVLEKCRPRVFIEFHPQFLPFFNRTAKDFFDAIPRSHYRVLFRRGGETKFREYEDGDHLQATKPGILIAEPR